MAKELLFSITAKDFDITYFSGKGAGGQHRNKHKNCVRIKHKETGIITTGQESRKLEQNKRMAFKRMCENIEFKKWLKIKSSKESLNKDDINKKVDEMMKEENLKIEYF